jgi:hypothetical protein
MDAVLRRLRVLDATTRIQVFDIEGDTLYEPVHGAGCSQLFSTSRSWLQDAASAFVAT